MKTESMKKIVLVTAAAMLIGGSQPSWLGTIYAAKTKTEVASSTMRVAQQLNEKSAFGDEASLISNLKLATKVLNTAFSTGELTPQMYENITKHASTIDAKIATNGLFSKPTELKTVFEDTIKVVDRDIDIYLKQPVREKKKEGVIALSKLQSRVNSVILVLGTGSDTEALTQTVQGKYSKVVAQSHQKLGQIEAKYGKHSYDVANQTEYDFVMKKVESALQAGSGSTFITGKPIGNSLKYQSEIVKAMTNYLQDSDKKENYERDSMQWAFLSTAEKAIKPLKEAGIDNATIIKAINSGKVGADMIRGIKDPQNGLPQSLYDSLGRALADCDTDAHTFSAVFDAAGFNTAVMSRPGHADVLVEISGKWFVYSAGTFKGYSQSLYSHYKVTVSSTFGNAVK